MTLEEKKQQLAALMDEYTKQDVCLALSGGVDSALLAWWAGKYAAKNQRKVYGVTFDTVLHPAADLEAARQSARDAGILHKVITVNELEFAEIADNPRNRCYLCKKGLFEQLIRFGKERGISTFLEGTNQDDLSVYRPGLQAVRELGVHSPLAQCQITKAEVRQLAREAGIQVASRPSAPCMATRLPYGGSGRGSAPTGISRGAGPLPCTGGQNRGGTGKACPGGTAEGFYCSDSEVAGIFLCDPGSGRIPVRKHGHPGGR